MGPIKNSQLLNMLEQKSEAHLRDALLTFQNLDSSMLLAPSLNGGWSIAQCLKHLNTYAHFYLPAIKQAMKECEVSLIDETFKSTWLGNYFTRIMDPKTGKKKYKAFKNHIPSEQLDAHAVVAEFIEYQEMLLQLLHQAREFDLNKVRIPLSIFKMVTFKLGDAFRFIVAHNERHLQQAKRNLVMQNV